MKLSIVVPVFNEGGSVRLARAAITRVMETEMPHWSYEIIFLDDGSVDDSFSHLNDLAGEFTYVRVIKFVRNCGSHMAIRAGLEHATGDVACFLACDLQDPAENIPQMVKHLVEPIEIVWAVRRNRQDGFVTQLFSKCFYRLARAIVSKNIPPNGASMFLLGPKALKAVSLFRERNLTLEGLFATMGLPQDYIEYDRQARQFGSSKWTLGKRLNLLADFFVAYSVTPLRMISYAGMAFTALGTTLVAAWLAARFFTPIGMWSLAIAIILAASGAQMIALGIAGEYIWRTLDEVRGRPRYMIETFLNQENRAVRETLTQEL